MSRKPMLTVTALHMMNAILLQTRPAEFAQLHLHIHCVAQSLGLCMAAFACWALSCMLSLCKQFQPCMVWLCSRCRKFSSGSSRCTCSSNGSNSSSKVCSSSRVCSNKGCNSSNSKGCNSSNSKGCNSSNSKGCNSSNRGCNLWVKHKLPRYGCSPQPHGIFTYECM